MTPLGGQFESSSRTLDKLPTSARNMVRVLVVGNSKITSYLITQGLIDLSDNIIACDGAIEKCLDRSIKVDYVIGDMDSLERKTIEELQLLDLEVIKIDDQNNNDLSKLRNEMIGFVFQFHLVGTPSIHKMLHIQHY